MIIKDSLSVPLTAGPCLIPSPKAEPFKRWLAKVGYERVKEMENPELTTKRTRTLYKFKGYSDDWIEKRMRRIAIREELSSEW